MPSEAAVKRNDAPLLDVRGVSVHYDGAISALENIDFSVSEKALVALLGANGAGKTTLMKAIAGMLPLMAFRARERIRRRSLAAASRWFRTDANASGA
jgi:ABC-type branched-subunit amino acid transport system ATPase component